MKNTEEEQRTRTKNKDEESMPKGHEVPAIRPLLQVPPTSFTDGQALKVPSKTSFNGPFQSSFEHEVKKDSKYQSSPKLTEKWLLPLQTRLFPHLLLLQPQGVVPRHPR